MCFAALASALAHWRHRHGSSPRSKFWSPAPSTLPAVDRPMIMVAWHGGIPVIEVVRADIEHRVGDADAMALVEVPEGTTPSKLGEFLADMLGT